MPSEVLQYAAASLAAGLLVLWAMGNLAGRWRLWVGLAACALSLAPISGGLSVAQMILSANPSFSVVIICMMLSAFISRATGGRVELIDARSRESLAWLTLGLSLIVMPASLGVWPVDVYAMGYSSRPLVLVMGAYALLMLLRAPAIGVVVAMAAGAYALGLVPSGNLFDSLIDGAGLLYSVAILAGMAIGSDEDESA